MTPPPAIEAQNLGKNFRLYPSGWAHLADLARPGTGRAPSDNWVLRDVSFTVAARACIGIIGRNGSGKSTLLKLISQALHPTEGQVAVRGRLLGLLELGAGFNPEFTGRQNVVLSTQLLGLPTAYAGTRMRDIEAFAEIGVFFDRPVKTYSSGMFVRLAFATFMFMEPDVFVVDEALSVGDLFFQQKCFAAIADMRAKGTTIIFVSHDMSLIRNLCDRVIVLDVGRVIFDGDPAEAVMRYYLAHQPASNGIAPAPTGTNAAETPARNSIRNRSILTQKRRLGSRALEIEAVKCTDERGQDTLVFRMKDKLTIEILVQAHEALAEPNVGFELYDRFNMLVYGISVLNLGGRIGPLAAHEARVIAFTVDLSLMPGEYALSVAAADLSHTVDPNAGRILDRHEQLGPIQVTWGPSLMPFYGLADLGASCDIRCN